MVPPCAKLWRKKRLAQKEAEVEKQIAVHDFCNWLETQGGFCLLRFASGGWSEAFCVVAVVNG